MPASRAAAPTRQSFRREISRASVRPSGRSTRPILLTCRQRCADSTEPMFAVLRACAAILTWLAWLALAPSFGLPETAPAAMFDRLLSSTGWGWLVVLCGETATVGPPDAQARGESEHVVAEGPVEAVRAGTTFVSVLRLPQPAGAVLGPHSHIPGFTYVLGGVATVAFVYGKTVDVVAGEAVFTPANVVHVHSNERGRGVAIALAVLLIGAVVGLVMLSRRGWRWTPLWLVGLVTIGAIGVADHTLNDWYFIAGPPAAPRGGAMPVPAARRTHESAALADLGPGPFLERLDAFVIEPGGRTMAHRSDGAETLIVTDGRATICVGGAKTTVERDQALTVQANTPLQLLNVGTAPLGVVRFSVRPKSGQLETLVESSPC